MPGQHSEGKKQLVNEYMKSLALEMGPLNSSADQQERQLHATESLLWSVLLLKESQAPKLTCVGLKPH